ncbi:hypothetical protein [Clostridium sp. BNL1100]|uniref:hypothetical protein n=1 Tax=Clostridium sp. BNL1100 TaxID=755731 RepID=UPI00024A79C9|nr:hypothetical protein [Clostridium sp. BNL1100]AEY67912.1 hypothetical protein Clo1100_3798 [Clostridium sp. BNL1100]
MIKEELSQIIKLKKEIKQLNEKLQELSYGDNETIVTDKVRGSMAQFPYLPKSFTITGREEMSEECIKERNEIGVRIRIKTQSLMGKINKTYEFIESIEDSTVRQIMVYRYIDGLTWEQTGECMSYSWETVRKKHDKFLKTIPTNTSIYDVK